MQHDAVERGPELGNAFLTRRRGQRLAQPTQLAQLAQLADDPAANTSA